MQLKIRRKDIECFSQMHEALTRHGCVDRTKHIGFARMTKTLPSSFKRRVKGGWFFLTSQRLRLRKFLNRLIDERLSSFRGRYSLSRQTFRIDFSRRRMIFDFSIHHRLRERRFVAFIMSVLAVANEIDENIASEFLPPFSSDGGYS